MLHYSLVDVTQTALINEGLLTREQLSKARKIAEHLNGEKTLGDVLLEMNWISQPRLEELVRRSRSRGSISDILNAPRLVTDSDVRAARASQRKTTSQPKRIGETLVE